MHNNTNIDIWKKGLPKKTTRDHVAQQSSDFEVLRSGHEKVMLRHVTLIPLLQITRQEDTSDKASQEHNVVDTFTFGGRSFPAQWTALLHCGFGIW